MKHQEIGPFGQNRIVQWASELKKRGHGSAVARVVALTLSLPAIAISPVYAEVRTTFDSTIKYGEIPRFVVEVTGDNPTGTITLYGSNILAHEPSQLFIVDDYVLCAAPVIEGKAVCVLEEMRAYFKQEPKDIPEMGLKAVPPYWSIQIDYSGDKNNPSSSVKLKQVIGYKAVRLSGTAVPNNPVAGQDVVLSAVVRTGDIDGSVAFSRAGKPIAGCESVTVASLPETKYSWLPGSYIRTAGVATCTVKALGAGDQSFDLAYVSTDGARKQSAAMNFQVRNSDSIADRSGMYWNPAESGWGMSVVQHGDRQMNVIYGYDELKAARWYVMPGGSWNAAKTTFTGTLYQPTSAPYDAYDAKAFKVNASVGEAAITYLPSGKLTLAYTINGERSSKELTKMAYEGNNLKGRMNVADMWWGGENDQREYGWGISIVQEENQIYPVWFTYDAQGKSTWHPLMRAPEGYASYLPEVFAYRHGWYEDRFITHVYALKGTKAPAENYLSSSLVTELTGTVTLTFQDHENAVFSHTVPCDGTHLNACVQMKMLKRQKF